MTIAYRDSLEIMDIIGGRSWKAGSDLRVTL